MDIENWKHTMSHMQRGMNRRTDTQTNNPQHHISKQKKLTHKPTFKNKFVPRKPINQTCNSNSILRYLSVVKTNFNDESKCMGEGESLLNANLINSASNPETSQQDRTDKSSRTSPGHRIVK